MGNPQNIREEIAELLKLDKNDRDFLRSQSITTLIESLIQYTKSLEKGYSLKGKNELDLSDFIIKFKQHYKNYLKEQYKIDRFELFMLEGKIVDRALIIFDEVKAEKGTVTELDLVRSLQEEKEKPLPIDVLKRVTS